MDCPFEISFRLGVKSCELQIGLNSGVIEEIGGFSKFAILQIPSRISNQHPALPGRLKLAKNCFAQFFVCSLSRLMLFGNRRTIRSNQFVCRPSVEHIHADWPASTSCNRRNAAVCLWRISSLR